MVELSVLGSPLPPPIKYSGHKPGRAVQTLCTIDAVIETLFRPQNTACRQQHPPRKEQTPTPPAKTTRKAESMGLGLAGKVPE